MLPVVVTVEVSPDGVVVCGVDWVIEVRFVVSGLELEEWDMVGGYEVVLF